VTASSRDSRPLLVGLVGGLVVLGLLVAFAVLLPATGNEPDDLPDSLPGGLRAVDLVAEEADGDEQTADFARRQRGISASGEERLEELFDAPVQVRSYQDEALEGQATITVIETESGPFLPNGPPYDPTYLDLERNVTDLVSVGDGVCALYWQQPVPEGTEIEADQEEPQALQCQLGADGVTYQFYGRGVTPEEAVDLLEGLAH
jgi:hypothetical protein